ncbi:MAG: 16S rRNA (cytidine(1402)-2'-O)-methyltransferase [Acidimicrobiales bacterium]
MPAGETQGSEPGGRVVLVGTPIGNLGDLSPRAVDALSSADAIYCEDTRHTRRLLTHAGISGVRLRSLHEHNEGQRTVEVLKAATGGSVVAVVSDAGMPGISDPGSRLVAAAVEAGVAVSVVPGPSAVVAALVVSGLPTDRFCFEGFLARSGTARSERLAALAAEERTVVLFEAPSRVGRTLEDLASACGPLRRVAVARELTKVHEEVWRGTLAEAGQWVEEHPVRGEVVLVLEGAPAVADEVDDRVLAAAIGDGLRAGDRLRGVVDEVAATFDVPRRRVYELALAQQETGRDPPPSSERGE